MKNYVIYTKYTTIQSTTRIAAHAPVPNCRQRAAFIAVGAFQYVYIYIYLFIYAHIEHQVAMSEFESVDDRGATGWTQLCRKKNRSIIVKECVLLSCSEPSTELVRL